MNEYNIDYVEIYSPMAKALAYWHVHALGFTVKAYAGADTGLPDVSSYVLESGEIRLVITSTYPVGRSSGNAEIADFISRNCCGVKRIALRVPSVKHLFETAVANGAFPIKAPVIVKDDSGVVEEAAIRLYDQNEIVFVNRDAYKGVFKPGYVSYESRISEGKTFLSAIDHIAGEVRINESGFWTSYLARAIGTFLVQSIESGEENTSGMLLKINQSSDKKLTLVIAEPETYLAKSKVQKNIEMFGPGIHHLAFSTPDMMETVKALSKRGVEFITFPPSYYELLRSNSEFDQIDIDALEKNGILIDKEEDGYLLQKFIKPLSDRPFFLYEVVQRVNGYDGFALKNINVLKKAEEMEVMRH